MVLDIQTVHHILKNTAVQNVNKPFVYITDLTSTLKMRYSPICACAQRSPLFIYKQFIYVFISFYVLAKLDCCLLIIYYTLEL
jgi:hypothetical protein